MTKLDYDLGLNDKAIERLKKCYLWRDEKGNVVETPYGLVKRVTKVISSTEKTASQKKKWQEKFEEVMVNKDFWPGTMILLNAGKPQAHFGNCYVLPIDDSIEGIFQTLYDSSVVKKHGGGFGCNFSGLRPKDDSVGGIAGLAAGPVKLMRLFDDASGIYIAQNRYMGGNMIMLDTSHPDIIEFLSCKEQDGTFPWTNISITASDAFMRAVQADRQWKLVNPRTGKTVNKIPARTIIDLAAHYAHKTGDPGLMFIDNANRNNPLAKGYGSINCTNLCGELPLYPYEACNLGYINLVNFILPEDKQKSGKLFDYKRLGEVAKVAVRFMDDTVEAASFPVEKITEMVKNVRRLGIGVCGWADCLAELEIPYDSDKALKLGEELMSVVADACHEESFELGEEKGPFPYADKSIWARKKNKPRNIGTNTLPPSSSNAVIFNVSYSIEPFFGLAYQLNILDGDVVSTVNETLLRKLKKHNIKVDRLIEKTMEASGSIQKIKGIPTSIKRVFKTTHDIDYKAHIKMQAAFQKYTDNSISKTINLPNSATEDDVRKAFMLSWKLGCKGITVYRDGSKQGQVINYGSSGEKK